MRRGGLARRGSGALREPVESVETPNQLELSAWVDQYDLFNNTLMPGVTDANTILDVFERRECTNVIETGCMTVQWKLCTCTSGQCTTSAEIALDELAVALGG